MPHAIRRQLLTKLDQLSTEVRYLRADVGELESVFRDAQFPQGPTLRLGNGAMLTLSEFHRYERIADQVFSHLKKLHKLTLKAQGLAFDLPITDKRQAVNVAGEALARAERLMQGRDYTVNEAWRELVQLANEVEAMIRQLRVELGQS
jgi:conjugal transfer/entry exclusion protein